MHAVLVPFFIYKIKKYGVEKWWITAIEIAKSNISDLQGSFKESAAKTSYLASFYLHISIKLTLLSVPIIKTSGLTPKYLPLPQPISATKDPIGRLFSASGLTFYGGLILAAIAICWYAAKKGIKVIQF